MSSRYDVIREILNALVKDNPYINFAEIVSVDGLPIMSSSESPMEESIAAMTAAMSGVATRFISELKKEKIDWIGVFAGDGSGAIIIDISTEAFLVAMFTPGAKLGLILHDIKKARAKLSEAMA
ncbi:MAG: hypothetical protein DRJ38_06150 [Thermoprotei archaeon]|nr:MAG: hypothetical protein DRJ38_06150 [Thermoprotei archaeon]